MKKNDPKYLSLYYRWMENEQMGDDCLCNFFLDNTSKPRSEYREFELINPTEDDLSDIQRKRLNNVYWGSGEGEALRWQFTPLRQNLVLLMAALNNEL